MVIVSVLLLMLMPLAATAQSTADQSESVSDPAEAVSVAPQAADDQIALRLQRILTTTGWYAQLGVSVRDGVVFLDGAASTPERQQWARDLAAKTEDVVAVVNRLQVDETPDWSLTPAWREVVALGRQTIAALPLLLLALIVLPVAWLMAGLVRRVARGGLSRNVPSVFLADILARVVAAPILFLGIYVVLQTAGLTQLAVSLLGGAGVIGIVIGFAFRDIAENFLASLLLSIRTPFLKGDFIDVGGSLGLVQSMDTRSTTLLSVEGNHITIPNAAVFKSTIVNYTAAPARRETFDVGVGYDVALTKAQDIVLGVLIAHEGVVADPPPMALVEGLGSSTVVVRAYFWFDGRAVSGLKLKSALLRLVKGALIQAGVSMPDDAREVIFPEGVPVLGADTAMGPAYAPPAVEPTIATTDPEADLSSEDAALQRRADASDNNLVDDTNNLLAASR